MVLLALDVRAGLLTDGGADVWWLLPLIGALGYITADFVSGFVHFLADNIGSTRAPIVGPLLIRRFREHHVDPLAITRKDFLQVNGANCGLSLPLLLSAYYAVPVADSRWGALVGAYVVMFLFGIFLTNQFHNWAHQSSVPWWVRALQRSGAILSPEHHARHHAPPFNTYYCITCGWLNPLLTRLQLFERIQGPLRRVLEPLVGKADEVGGVYD